MTSMQPLPPNLGADVDQDRFLIMSLFLLAAEPSGDLHGAALIEQLLAQNPNLKIYAVAGPEMRKYPIEVIEPMESFCVMGFLDVLAALPRLLRLFRKLKKTILSMNPDQVVTIDYPGLHLRLQQALRKAGYQGKQIHYICPTVWAWGKRRIQTMERSLDLLLTILPFEPACFASTTLRAEYVGHPLIQKIPPTSVPRQKILALFPGSRTKEIERNLPLQLEVARKLQALDPTLEIAIATSSNLQKIAPEATIYPPERRYELMQKARLAIAKSGTVILELALHQTSTIVQYVIHPFDEFLATRVFRIHLPYYSLPNLLLQEELFPELFGSNLTLDRLFEKANHLWFNDAANEHLRANTRRVRDLLGPAHASRVAASKILNA